MIYKCILIFCILIFKYYTQSKYLFCNNDNIIVILINIYDSINYIRDKEILICI